LSSIHIITIFIINILIYVVYTAHLPIRSYNQHTASSGALYPDEGSAYSTWHHNVVTDIGTSEWLHLWTASIHNVTVR
jgi:hypothetical protein